MPSLRVAFEPSWAKETWYCGSVPSGAPSYGCSTERIFASHRHINSGASPMSSSSYSASVRQKSARGGTTRNPVAPWKSFKKPDFKRPALKRPRREICRSWPRRCRMRVDDRASSAGKGTWYVSGSVRSDAIQSPNATSPRCALFVPGMNNSKSSQYGPSHFQSRPGGAPKRTYKAPKARMKIESGCSSKSVTWPSVNWSLKSFKRRQNAVDGIL
mmetsp:Transcript_4426/g.15653  ORF Transcript_4426/g.15653 Transcript_4426/m.15653 type:complete len:215 (+) Transcript_4426:713-1357(+)